MKRALIHRLEISAGRLQKIWFVFALLAGAGAGGLVALRSVGIIGKGGTSLPLLILAVMCLIISGFCWILGSRARQEFAMMRRGDYVARWIYPASDHDLARADGAIEGRSKVKLLFHLPFWPIFVVGTGLGIMGAFAKADPMIALRIGAFALVGGLVVGAFFAIPAHFLIGVTTRIARELEPEVVFTKTGIYVPGRFYPVMDFVASRRSFTVSKGSTGDGGSPRSWLEMRLLQGVHHAGASPNQTISVFSQFLVPEGKEDEAREMAAYFSGGE